MPLPTGTVGGFCHRWSMKLDARPIRRWRCHGNAFLCCQYTDKPTCNSARETHLLGRLVWRRNARRDSE